MHRTSRAHNRPSNLIRNTIGNPARVIRRRSDVLLISASSNETGVLRILAVILTPGVAVLAVVADVPDGLDAAAVADRPALHVGADFDNDAGAFVTGRSVTAGRHWWDGPVVHHEVDVAHAEAGAVEFEEEFVGALIENYQ